MKRILVFTAALFLTNAAVAQQSYPNRPLRLVIPWPPGPRYAGDRLAFVYNVYTEPAHRRRGLARLIMETIHAWCRDEGIGSVALNASRDGKRLYEAMGYAESTSPMMFLPIVRV